MTTTPKLQPKPIRKTMTDSTVVITKQRDFTHKEPVIIPSHLDEIPVISAASYIKDARIAGIYTMLRLRNCLMHMLLSITR